MRPGDRATLRWAPETDKDAPIETVPGVLVLRVDGDRAVVAVPDARLADLPTRVPAQIAR